MNFKFLTAIHRSACLNFSYGVRDMLPLSLAVIPWALMAGALAIQAGLTVLQAIAMSVFIFAGAAQIMSLTMLMAGASQFSILLVIFFITLQHFIYALSLRQDICQMPFFKRLSLGFLLTDELYAISALYPHRRYAYLFGAGLSFYVFWVGFSVLGVMLTAGLNYLGSIHLDYSIVAIFLVMTVLLIKNKYSVLAVMIAATLSLLFKYFNCSLGVVLASLIAMLVATGLEQRGK